MLGGARIVRVVVLQESRMTVSAAMPPVHQRILSRFSQNRWMSLECLTTSRMVIGNRFSRLRISTEKIRGVS
jgi:hypothetical protein